MISKKINNYNILSKLPTFLAFFHDVCAVGLAWFFSYLLRFNFSIPSDHLTVFWQMAIFVVPFQSFIFVVFGLYKGVWRFASIPDFKRILNAVSVAAIVLIAILFMFKPMHIIVPRSVLILNPILLLLIMGGSRFAYRSWKEYILYGLNKPNKESVLVLGAGAAAIALLKDLERSSEWHVVGLLDEDDAIQGRTLLGFNVLGKVTQLPEIAKALNISNVIIAKPSDAHQARRQALDVATQAGLNVFTVPSIEDLMSGKVKVSKIRQVEVEDLLGRDVVRLDNTGLQNLIEGNVVFVSGAGGSIGSEICRQIIRYSPSVLICFDISEYALYSLEQEIESINTSIKFHYFTGDVKNIQRVNDLLNMHKPTLVFHAAAYKHVPLMENGNVHQSLSNNVIGTHTLAQACKKAGVKKFVLISTDKAVNPANVMGASKRLAEMVCQGLQESEGTSFVIVRFGNVLGSSGSVIPKFREQIAKGGPVTVTHPEITRYFMSIPEAAQLVMQAGLMGAGGEIFVLDMGEPVKIVELAKDMISLSGLHHDDIKIEFTGLRPGEKLYEELLADDEQTLPTHHEKLRIAVARSADMFWVQSLVKWIHASASLEELLIKKELKIWVQEYTPDLKATRHEPTHVPSFSTMH